MTFCVQALVVLLLRKAGVQKVADTIAEVGLRRVRRQQAALSRAEDLFNLRAAAARHLEHGDLLACGSTSGSEGQVFPEMGSLGIKEFPYEEILQATNSFSDGNLIGAGGYGSVYKGTIKDGRQVAVKRLKQSTLKRREQFLNEVHILASLKHRSLVQFYGISSCHQSSSLSAAAAADLLLIFEYAPNGTLADHLHRSAGGELGLPWTARLTVALETAEALSYLHNSVSPPIFHRDVKPSNILLDARLRAKLADFGLSKPKLSEDSPHISTAPQGTPGYLDPEYYQSFQLTDKSDVYSFGVVLLELVSGKLAVDLSRDSGEVSLVNMARAKTKHGGWEDIADPRLLIPHDPVVEKMVKDVVALALACIRANKHKRPTMAYVARALVTIKENGYQHDGDNFRSQEFVSPSYHSFFDDEMSQILSSPSVASSMSSDELMYCHETMNHTL